MLHQVRRKVLLEDLQIPKQNRDEWLKLPLLADGLMGEAFVTNLESRAKMTKEYKASAKQLGLLSRPGQKRPASNTDTEHYQFKVHLTQPFVLILSHPEAEAPFVAEAHHPDLSEAEVATVNKGCGIKSHEDAGFSPALLRVLPHNQASPDYMEVSKHQVKINLQIPLPKVPVGARLLLFESQWVQITQDPWVLEIIRHEYALKFQNSTPMFQGIKRTFLSNTKQKEILRKEILTLLEKEAIVEVPKRSQNQGFYSTLFMVPKKNSEKLRPVINLKPLNQFLVKKTFKIDHLKGIIKVMQQGNWAVSIDLTDAYMHIPIRQSHQRFLRFAVDNQVWQFRALSFGPTTAPRIFTKLVSVVVQYLRHQGVQIWTYLDDWILTHQNPNQLLAHRDLVLNTLVKLGFLPNLIKSDLVPSQDVNFVGARFLLKEGFVTLPQDRAQILKVTVEQINPFQQHISFWDFWA